MLAEDLDAFLVDFGVACTIGGAAATGIFDKQYVEAYGMVAGNQPVLLVKDAAAASVVEGTAVVINAVTYSVAGMEPDGTGMTLLRLEL
jgi:hypothetical protein